MDHWRQADLADEFQDIASGHSLTRDPDFTPIATPVSREHLRKEGLGPAFLDYMATWKGFVEEPATADA